MKEITDEEYELFQRLTKIWFHSSEKSDSFFICGEAGNSDENGLPEYILVCPHDGINVTAVYEKKAVGRNEQ